MEYILVTGGGRVLPQNLPTRSLSPQLIMTEVEFLESHLGEGVVLQHSQRILTEVSPSQVPPVRNEK